MIKYINFNFVKLKFKEKLTKSLIFVLAKIIIFFKGKIYYYI